MKFILKLLICSFVLTLIITSCSTQEKVIVKTKTVHDTIYVTDVDPKYHFVEQANLKDYIVSKKNFPSVASNHRVKFIVLHYTVSDYPTSVKILAKKGNVSSHYLVNDLPNDSIDLLVSENQRAWHAGISSWGNAVNLNDTSIGIEIVNSGYKKIGDSMVFQPFPNYQIKKVISLVKNIAERYDIDPVNIIGHSDIAPLRKQDPGPAFPWEKLYKEHQLGAWYDEKDKVYFLNMYDPDTAPYNSVLEFQKALKKYGYSVNLTGVYDKNTKLITRAFQWHFRPQKGDGIIDAETWAILQALNKKYRTK